MLSKCPDTLLVCWLAVSYPEDLRSRPSCVGPASSARLGPAERCPVPLCCASSVERVPDYHPRWIPYSGHEAETCFFHSPHQFRSHLTTSITTGLIEHNNISGNNKKSTKKSGKQQYGSIDAMFFPFLREMWAPAEVKECLWILILKGRYINFTDRSCHG